MLSLIYLDMSVNAKKQVTCPECGITRMASKTNKYDASSIKRCRPCHLIYSRGRNNQIFNDKHSNKQ